MNLPLSFLASLIVLESTGVDQASCDSACLSHAFWLALMKSVIRPSAYNNLSQCSK